MEAILNGATSHSVRSLVVKEQGFEFGNAIILYQSLVVSIAVFWGTKNKQFNAAAFLAQWTADMDLGQSMDHVQ